MRGNKIMGVLWLIIAIVLAVIFFSKMKSNNSRSNSGIFISYDGNLRNAKNLCKSLTFSASEIKDIEINLISEAVYVEPATNSEITVELYCTTDNVPSVQQIRNVLKIEEKEKILNLSFEKRIVVVKIPESFKGENVKISTVSGSIHVENLNSSILECKSTSGSIHFDQCNNKTLNTKASSGSIHVNDCKIQELECSSQSGSVHLSGSIDKINVHSTSGSIKVNLSEQLKQDSNFNATSGSISLSVARNSNMNINYSVTSGSYKNAITGTSGKTGSESMGNNGPTVELHTTSGSIRVDSN